MRSCEEGKSGDEAENELFESFRASHLPWNLQFDPVVPPTHNRVDLGEPWVVGCTVGWMSGRRRARELRDTPGEYVALLMVHQGTEVLTQRGGSATVTAGTAALWDGVRPVDCFSATTLVKSTMFVPRDALIGAVPDLDSAFVAHNPGFGEPAAVDRVARCGDATDCARPRRGLHRWPDGDRSAALGHCAKPG